MPICRCGEYTDNENGYCDECQNMIQDESDDDEEVF